MMEDRLYCFTDVNNSGRDEFSVALAQGLDQRVVHGAWREGQWVRMSAILGSAAENRKATNSAHEYLWLSARSDVRVDNPLQLSRQGSLQAAERRRRKRWRSGGCARWGGHLRETQ